MASAELTARQTQSALKMDRPRLSPDTLRCSLAVGSIFVDLGALASADALGSFLGAIVRGESSASITLFWAVGPTYAIAAFALGSVRLSTLKAMGTSIRRSLLTLLVAVGCGTAAAFAFKSGDDFSRLDAGFFFFCSVCGLIASRILGYFLIRRLSRELTPRVLVVGQGGYPLPKLSAFAEGRQNRELSEITRADRILLNFPNLEENLEAIHLMNILGVDAEVLQPSFAHVRPLGLGMWKGIPTLMVSRGPLGLYERAMKRAMDLVVATTALIFLCPFLMTLMFLVKLTSPGPALFVQERVGYKNRRYSCFKLRTMRHDARDDRGGRSTSKDDDRVTALGHFLRKTSLDELPQLINVIRGEMSLVGPRPHALGSTAEGALFWEVVPNYWERHSMKPGITGYAQVNGFRGATLSQADIERRVAADLEYRNRWSLALDLKILFKTVTVLVHPNAF